ncbi:hypothetical protein Pcinc_009839 [Petrolisthes cinctipes]|uniref:Uncharacterized protein n=1 Tax=Petrolisthes cinctipes TaxID=88211 RepID=A0AAE1G628_PETCI|nr:hypothetical protein Pcinc_009839 [Petrolisthes cinctipes]
MENYLKYSMVGGNIKLKAGVLPHKFECQGRNTSLSHNRAALKRKMILQEILTDQENQIPIAGDAVSPMDGVMDMSEGNPGEDSNRHSGDLGLIEKASTRDCGLQVVLV